jgi:hypothetical protein
MVVGWTFKTFGIQLRYLWAGERDRLQSLFERITKRAPREDQIQKFL